MTEEKKTTWLSTKNRERLRKFGNKGDTWDNCLTIVLDLLDKLSETRGY